MSRRKHNRESLETCEASRIQSILKHFCQYGSRAALPRIAFPTNYRPMLPSPDISIKKRIAKSWESIRGALFITF